MMQIFVRTPGGTTLALDVGPNDTGLDLKVQIFQRTGIMPHAMWLSSGSRTIEDVQYLDERGIHRESTVICNVRAGGAPCEICSRSKVDGGGGARRGRTYLFFAPW